MPDAQHDLDVETGQRLDHHAQAGGAADHRHHGAQGDPDPRTVRGSQCPRRNDGAAVVGHVLRVHQGRPSSASGSSALSPPMLGGRGSIRAITSGSAPASPSRALSGSRTASGTIAGLAFQLASRADHETRLPTSSTGRPPPRRPKARRVVAGVTIRSAAKSRAAARVPSVIRAGNIGKAPGSPPRCAPRSERRPASPPDACPSRPLQPSALGREHVDHTQPSIGGDRGHRAGGGQRHLVPGRAGRPHQRDDRQQHPERRRRGEEDPHAPRVCYPWSRRAEAQPSTPW